MILIFSENSDVVTESTINWLQEFYQKAFIRINIEELDVLDNICINRLSSRTKKYVLIVDKSLM